MTTQDLLVLRLDALELDITKVLAAVTVAKDRGQLLDNARQQVGSCRPLLRAVEGSLDKLMRATEDEPKILELISETVHQLDRDLEDAPKTIAEVIVKVRAAFDSLGELASTAVALGEPEALQASLKQRCDELTRAIDKLRDDLTAQSGTRPAHWQRYRQLLNDRARPVFAEYVDFLGGLTIRDTGLDDRICEMTDALLGRFTALSRRPLPLPARQAALGNALDSVVLLGFPEWSIWGIPLVGHEVGLRYARDRNSVELTSLIRDFSSADNPKLGGRTPPTETYMQDLIADAFATYTLGFSYACAAMLLRLTPRADQSREQLSHPRDIDRARVIMMTLGSGPPSAPSHGGSFTEAVEKLRDIWNCAVRDYVEPPDADQAALEAAGPPPAQDWLDDFTAAVVKHLRSFGAIIRPYDNDRWMASDKWRITLADSVSRPESDPDDVVPDLLTAAWRMRLDEVGVDRLATDVKKQWSELTGRRPKGRG